MRLPFPLVLAALLLALNPLAQPLQAASTDTSADPRLADPKDLDGYFPFTPAQTPEAWTPRADEVRMRLRVALGLWPEPTRTPLNATIHGRIEQEDYTVEKVFFESMPGFFVSGSLFRPKGKPGPHPAVLCPHGHWTDGRLGVLSDAELKKEMESGQEFLSTGGRSIFQSLGVQLARMGCVAFIYDMIGYADSQQISFEVAHKFAKQTPELNAPEGWRLFSPRAESHLQSVMGLQTWNSIRAIDFITALPDVDPKRIGMTGGSGGGTQTFIGGALDPRVTVAFPAVMVSTAMQGGCTCENACLLRIGTGNVEFAALFAPRPLGMSAAKDWTQELSSKGFPDLRKHWAMLGKPEDVQLWSMLQFPHNYNAPTRERIYSWFNQHFALGLPEPIKEREYPLLTREQLSVWDEAHPAPPSGPDLERTVLAWWRKDAEEKVRASREIAEKGWQTMIGRDLPEMGDLEAGSDDGNKARVHIRHAKSGEKVALTLHHPEKPPKAVALWLDSELSGKAPPPEELRELLAAGVMVIVPDLFTPAAKQNRRVKNPRESAAYTYGYNHPLLIQRVHDAAMALVWIKGEERSSKLPAFVVARGSSAPIGALLRAHAPKLIQGAAIDSHGFRFASIGDYLDENFLPGAARYGDLPGLLRLGPSTPLFLQGEAAAPEALGADLPVTVSASRETSELVKWLKETALGQVTP